MAVLELDRGYLPVGTTAVHVAVNSGRVDGLQSLLDGNCSLIDHSDQYGNTPLARALLNGRLEAARVLIRYGANLDAPYHGSDSQCTLAEALVTVPLFYELLKFAVRASTSLHCDLSSVLPPLAHEGDVDTLGAVLGSSSITVDYRDHLKCTALHYGAQKGFVKIVSMLLMHGAKTMLQNASGSTALHLACSAGHLGIVTDILETTQTSPANAERLLNLKNMAGKTPVTCALVNAHLDVVQYLTTTHLEYLDMEQILHDGHNLPGLYFYLRFLSQPSLVKPPFRTSLPCLSNEEAQWLLHESVHANDSAALRLAISYGANVNCLDCMQQTPLILAAKLGFVGMCMCLVKCGANSNIADTSGKTPLVYAFEHGKHNVVSYLLSRTSISEFDPLTLSKPLCNSVLAVVVSTFQEIDTKPSNWLDWLGLAVPTATKSLFSDLVNAVAPHDWIQQVLSALNSENSPAASPRVARVAKYPTLPTYVQEEIVDASQKPQPKLVRSLSRPRQWTFARAPPSTLKQWTFKQLPRPKRCPSRIKKRLWYEHERHSVAVIHEASLHNLPALKFILVSCEDSALQEKVLLSRDGTGRTALDLVLPQFELVTDAVSWLELSNVSGLDLHLKEEFPLPESLLFEEALVQYICVGRCSIDNIFDQACRPCVVVSVFQFCV